ncbi:MAG: hypothetical protein KC503_30530 [Myxococcales bacterium]|nr:hypothetical protein [Myxococcales bacterium]
MPSTLAAVFLAGASKLVLVLHALCAIALVGSVTHNAVLAVMHMRRRYTRLALARTYVRIIAVLFPLTLLVGALAYPSYRVHVRPWLDANVSLMSALFEVKEHWIGLGFGALIAYVPLALRVDPRKPGSEVRLVQLLALAIAAAVWMALLSGLVAVAHRSI